MSKITSPQEKKKQSLALDHRSTFDGSNKGNRKTVPRAKANSHRDERRSVDQLLARTSSQAANPDAELIDSKLRTLHAKKMHEGFKKSPDSSLGTVVATKLHRRGSCA